MQASSSADLATLVSPEEENNPTIRHGKDDLDEQTPLLGRQDRTKKKRQASEWYAIIPLFFIMFSAAAFYPAQLQFYTEIFCRRYYDTELEDHGLLDQGEIPNNCSIPEIQEGVAAATAVIQLLNYGTTFFTVSYYGHIADSKSRKRVMVTSSLGLFLLLACNAATAHLYQYVGISLLFIGPFLRGLLAGDSGLMVAVQAYISDCTTVAKRTTAFGYMMASMLCGVMVGANASSIIIKATNGNLMSPLYMGCSILIFVMIFFAVIPESEHDTTQQHKQKPFLDQINVYKSIQQLIAIKPIHGRRYTLPLIALAQFLMAVMAMPPILLYAMLEFGWTAYEGGYYISFMSFLRFLQMMVIFPLLTKLFMKSGEVAQWKFNIWVARVGAFFEVVVMFGIAVSSNAPEFMLATIIGSFSILGQPAIRTLLTTTVAPEDVGQVLSAMAVLDALAWLIAQFGLNALYGATVTFMPSMTFVVCGSVGITALLAILLARHQPTQSSNNNDQVVVNA
ncbi:major facilitator superfamily domain-containing protein [Phascolomyces articulosus]|uniref:Major facilitator superfamily domain-containing protein n=1 Tax=Phascolomyces articulosus TaxID=60185 RepID=A0AAD5JU12_9FUNG|nr:major facilitator superfamily domain-containing protein [Phascolomyces articulosus]